MIVGHDHAFGADHDARPERVLDALPGHAELLAKEAPENGVVEERRHRLLNLVANIDVHHRGCGALHHGRKGLLDRRRALGNDLGHHLVLCGGGR